MTDDLGPGHARQFPANQLTVRPCGVECVAIGERAIVHVDTAEVEPGPDVQSDEQWDQYIRANVVGVNHPVGTCKMGSDAEAVVDCELAVIGVTGLHVVDASVMPTLIGGHTNAPTIMIAERAADLIQQQ